MSNYATKTDLKNVTHVDTSNFALKPIEVDKLDVDKLLPIPADLSKLSNVVNLMMLLKKLYMINWLQK